MKINPAWKKEFDEVSTNLREERAFYRENKEAYVSDMRELKNELKKDASEWDCEVINNMCRCAQERKVNMDVSMETIIHLKHCLETIDLRWAKYC